MKQRLSGIRPMLVVYTLIYVLVMILGSTWSWYVSSDVKVNKFRSPDWEFGVKVVDIFDPPGGVTPGDEVNKIVGAENTRTMPAFVRLMVMPTIVSDKGQPLEAIIGKQVQLNGMNSAKWVYGGDGYYYYLDVLGSAGSSTARSEDLFTSAKLSPLLDATYKDAKLNIVVKTEAIDIEKWHYRQAWWNSIAHPGAEPLSTIDDAFALKAK